MSNREILIAIKATVRTFFPDARVLLFGSRARGDNQTHSDYDLMVVTEQAHNPSEKMLWESKISKALVYQLNAPFDVFLQSQAEVEKKQNSTGHVVRYALRDAIEL